MFADWKIIEIEPYKNQAWYQIHDNGLAIRQVNHCGEIIEALASSDYIDDLLGVNIQKAEDEVLQMAVCGVLMDEQLVFKTVGVMDGVKQ